VATTIFLMLAAMAKTVLGQWATELLADIGDATP
jgi:hypothetical protein